MRRHRLESTVTIGRPIDDVWAFMIDLFSSARARGMTIASRMVSPGPPGVGSVVEQRAVMLGFETHLRFTVIEWDPPHAVVASLAGPFLRSARVTTRLTATSDGTRKVTTMDLNLSSAGILLWPLLGPLLRRDQAGTDRQQKALLEASHSDSAAG